MVHVLPRGADSTAVKEVLLNGTGTNLAPKRLVCLHLARLPIEFVLWDTQQHLDLHDGQVRAQAQLPFHFYRVFAAYVWMCLRARNRPRDRFALRLIQRHNHARAMYQRLGGLLGRGSRPA